MVNPSNTKYDEPLSARTSLPVVPFNIVFPLPWPLKVMVLVAEDPVIGGNEIFSEYVPEATLKVTAPLMPFDFRSDTAAPILL